MRRIAYVLSLVLIFTLPWEDSVSASGFGSLTRIMGFVVAAFWCSAVLIDGRFRKPHLFHLLVLLFFLWSFLSVFWSRDTESTMQRIKTYSQIFLLMLVFWETLQTAAQVNAGLQAYVLGAYVLVVDTFYNYVNGISIGRWEVRYSATGVNAVDLALILLLGLPVVMGLLSSGGQGPARAVLRTDQSRLHPIGHPCCCSHRKPNFPHCDSPIWCLSRWIAGNQSSAETLGDRGARGRAACLASFCSTGRS